ncbi:MAG TPA: lysophospholipid acyltransferase family protein [Limnobacter sp.]|nr:lysophospholipid acyltransferase family protein [Limnobacter sp.]
MNGLHYQPFSETQKARIGHRWLRSFALWDWLTTPHFQGMENIPRQGPVLLVGNHSIFAFADASLMVREIYKQHGIICRSLGLHEHFKIPLWGKLLANNGAVDGTRDNCRQMMLGGEHIVVYPGGGGEVMKRKGEQHRLRWKNRTGFAQMAIENNCTVVPFSTVGADDCYDLIFDNHEIGQHALGQLAIKISGLKGEEFPPLLKGLGPTLIPKPQRMYFKFHEPIEAGIYRSGNLEMDGLALRKQIESIVQEGIDELLALRANDDLSSLKKRLKNRAATSVVQVGGWFKDLLRR